MSFFARSYILLLDFSPSYTELIFRQRASVVSIYHLTGFSGDCISNKTVPSCCQVELPLCFIAKWWIYRREKKKATFFFFLFIHYKKSSNFQHKFMIDSSLSILSFSFKVICVGVCVRASVWGWSDWHSSPRVVILSCWLSLLSKRGAVNYIFTAALLTMQHTN